MMMHRLFTVTPHVLKKAALCKAPTVSFPSSISIRFFSEIAEAPRGMIRDLLKMDVARQRSLGNLSDYLKKTSESKDISMLERKIAASPINAVEEKLIDMVIERIREKYGIRSLSIEDPWPTILIVTHPEQWVKEKVAQEGLSIVSALIDLMKYIVPNVSCISIEDLQTMLSLTSANEAEKNESLLDEDFLVDVPYHPNISP